MITRDGLTSTGRLALCGASVALMGLLLFLACNRESTRADIVGPEEPTATPEDVGGGPLSLANLTLPYHGSTSSGPIAAFVISQESQQYGSGLFQVSSDANDEAALSAYHFGAGVAFAALNTGTGSAGWFRTVSGSTATVLDVAGSGTGTAVSALATGGGSAGVFRINNTSTSAAALAGFTNGTGNAVLGLNSGNGSAGSFTNLAQGNKPAVFISTFGTGPGLEVEHRGGSGPLALFQVGNDNRIRFTRDGKGFFNGGTQTGGADVAEAFAVEGRASAYEPGDVLVVSTRSDRRVEKTTEPYSTRVVGVYATKPGVLLTERGIDDSLADLVPVGVIGVIPTKVSAENGPIRRGDLLVTASRPGHAMRATPVVIQGVTLYPTGAILGRALEEFRGPGSGVITALVNVK